MSRLFSPLTLRGTTFRNRAWISPMCQYSSVDGHPTDWHLVHLGSFARGGAGLVVQEATAVTAEGRISPWDAGIWTDAQAADYRRITRFIADQGAVPGIQLAHAGRKGSSKRPWDGRGFVGPEDGGWTPVGPTSDGYPGLATPTALSTSDVRNLVGAWRDAAVRADAAGFELIEIHAAHGYLLHEFLSPLTNTRTDAYGEDRARLLTEVVDAVREVWPERKPLFVRLTGSDWAPGGLTVDDAVAIAKGLDGHGVDLVDVSSGGLVQSQEIVVGPGYQVPFARAVREQAGVPTAAVGLITAPEQAEQIVVDGSADAVMLARAVLRDPSWPQRAAYELKHDESEEPDALYWAPQYERARPAR
ncbi:MAG TPA: NADH:flavin oxidoreductase/NADH oxidase [Mycobacteriales bacterium]|nr:NADH:flavin oxidoreductase/NADH oxidase [Mycobacteriales bacterium]